MRRISLLIAVVLAVSPAAAQQQRPGDAAAQPSPAASAPSSPPDAKVNPELPVSLDRIREALDRPAAPGQLLKALDRKPDYRIEIREKQKLDELIATLDFKSGPTPAGGIYAAEQQRMLVPPVDNPLAQPYAAFNQAELATILVENLVGRYLVDKAASAITKAQRAAAEAAARREVDEAISEYCASKPANGAGIQLCMPPPTAVSSATP